MHAKPNRHHISRQQYHNKSPNTHKQYWDLFSRNEFPGKPYMDVVSVRPSATWCQDRFGLKDWQIFTL
jgi:predicted 3-demethylubiquinone-9 3-methyltransferase (glyoxalase superfamily)